MSDSILPLGKEMAGVHFATIGSGLARLYRVMDARRQFGEYLRRSREQLWFIECSPNFPNVSITRYKHS